MIGIQASPWFVCLVRTGTPRGIVNKLAGAIRDAVQDKDIAAKIGKNSVEIESRSGGNCQDFSDIQSDVDDVAKNAKIVAE
ncbi:MAG: hypothetical protein ACXWX7_13490 [Candidatus Binatia bacterium]